MLAAGEHDIIVGSVVQSDVWERNRVNLYIAIAKSQISHHRQQTLEYFGGGRGKKFNFSSRRVNIYKFKILEKGGKKSRRHVWLAWVDEEEVE